MLRFMQLAIFLLGLYKTWFLGLLRRKGKSAVAERGWRAISGKYDKDHLISCRVL